MYNDPYLEHTSKDERVSLLFIKQKTRLKGQKHALISLDAHSEYGPKIILI